MTQLQPSSLAISCIYNSFIFNPTLQPLSPLNGHFYLYSSINLENEFFNKEFYELDLASILNNTANTIHSTPYHPFIRNYNNIINNKRFYNIEIIQSYSINNIEFCILKTFWLRLFQRIYKSRLRMIQKNKSIKVLNKRRIISGYLIRK